MGEGVRLMQINYDTLCSINTPEPPLNDFEVTFLKGLCHGSPVHFVQFLPITRPQSLWNLK